MLTNVKVFKCWNSKILNCGRKNIATILSEFFLSNPFFPCYFLLFVRFFLLLRVCIVFCRKSFRFFILVIFRLFTLRFFGFCWRIHRVILPLGGVNCNQNKRKELDRDFCAKSHRCSALWLQSYFGESTKNNVANKCKNGAIFVIDRVYGL